MPYVYCWSRSGDSAYRLVRCSFTILGLYGLDWNLGSTMRRSYELLKCAGFGVSLLCAGAAQQPLLAQDTAEKSALPSRLETVAVVVDHARVIRLPEKTATVIVGNPIVADVSVQKNGVLVVTGKSFGVTNLIALDSSGSMLAESHISVRAATDSIMTVHRGLDRESYSCTPHCQPSIQLGDSNKYFGEAGGQATQRNTLSTPGK
jgi:Pilus formation protein N terminal region